MKPTAVLFIVALLSPAIAAEPVPIDFTQKLYGATGKALTQGGEDCKQGEIPGKDCTTVDLTLEALAVQALELPIDTDRNEDPRKKFDRDSLARKIHADPAKVLLSVEDLALVKDRIGKVWNAPQVGAAWRLLDPTLK